MDGGGGGVMSDVVVGFSQYRRRLLLMRRAAVVVQSLIAFCTARFPAVKSSGRDATSAAAVRSNDNSMEITIEANRDQLQGLPYRTITRVLFNLH